MTAATRTLGGLPLEGSGLHGLRIAYAAFEPFPNAKGSGTRIGQMVQALAEAGAQVRLFTLSGRNAQEPLPPTVEHRPLALEEPNFLRRGEKFRQWLLRELVAFKPSVLHYRGIFEAQAAEAYAERSPALCVFEVNGLFSVELMYHYPRVAEALDFQRKLRALEARALAKAHLIVTQSQTTRAFLRDHAPDGCPDCVVIPNGADPSRYPSRERSGRDVPSLLYVGTLAPWQGVAELLMATGRVARRRPVRLILAGPVRRHWRRQIERTARRLGLGEHIELLGPLDREALVHYIADSDICISPLRRDARNTRQGCSPIKIFEYMAAGRAVVSTDLPCVREIIVPDECGLLATSERPSALADPILRLLEDPILAQRLGQNARQQITDHATWHHRREALRNAYREYLIPRLCSGDNPARAEALGDTLG